MNTPDTNTPGLVALLVGAITHCGDASGRQLDGQPNGVRIADCMGGLTGNCARATREEAVSVMALHEFGHALGFQHEEDRTDDGGRVSCGLAADSDGASDQRFGAYDEDSVMSTCGVQDHPASWTELSPTDLAAAQYVYGRRIPGSLLMAGGLCLKGGGFTPRADRPSAVPGAV